MRYGRVITTKTIHESEEASVVTRFIERIKVNSSSDLLAEMLKAHERYKKDEITGLRIKTIEKQNKLQFVEISYCKVS